MKSTVYNFYRFSNAVLKTKSSVSQIWNVLKSTKSKLSLFEKTCHIADGSYEDLNVKQSLLATVESKLKIQSSDKRLDNMNIDLLHRAAEMFVYLYTCPSNTFSDTYKPWFILFKDIFQTQPPDKILLTINRMIKSIDAEPSQYISSTDYKRMKTSTKNLLNKTILLFGLEDFEETISILSIKKHPPEEVAVVGNRTDEFWSKMGMVIFF